MKVVTTEVRPAAASPDMLDRWLDAQERRDRSRTDGESPAAAAGTSPMRPPQPVWPRVFPGL